MIFHNISEATWCLAKFLLEHGEKRTARDLYFLEVRNVSWEVSNPLFHLLPVSIARFPHPFQLLYETLWVLSGGSRIDTLKNYIPRAAEFSDDGLTWRGAYGPRIDAGLRKVISSLLRDTYTRQAYLPIYWSLDTGVMSKDIPCNVGLSFNRRGDFLDITRFCRSNDLILGYSGINHFEFSILLALVAGRVGLKPGKYFNYVVSLHAYDKDMEKLRRIAESDGEAELLHCATNPSITPTIVDLYLMDYMVTQEIKYVTKGVEAAWGSRDGSIPPSLSGDVRSSFLNLARQLLLCHVQLRKGRPVSAAQVFYNAHAIAGWTDLTLMSYLFLARNKEFKQAVSSLVSIPIVPNFMEGRHES